MTNARHLPNLLRRIALPVVRTALPVILLVLPAAPAWAQDHRHGAHTPGASPYADFTDRDIKALSEEEVAGLLEGHGMGMALPAELNGYPGPRHVLELADMLQLTDDQRVRIQEIFQTMETRAVELGQRVVALERELDRAFAGATLTPGELSRLLSDIGQIRAQLRGAHLLAHLEVYPLLTEAQRNHYDMARGYR